MSNTKLSPKLKYNSYVCTVSPGAIYTEISEATAPIIGESYRLVCIVLRNVSGLTSKPTAQWFNSSEEISRKFATNSSLEFSTLKTSHAGSYRCEGSVTSPAVEQPLVTISTWELTVRSKSLIPIVSAHRRILGMASVVCVLVKICVSSISLYKLDTDKLTAPFESAHQFTLVCTVSDSKTVPGCHYNLCSNHSFVLTD